ncbi:hypothetical protein T265_09511 [Opisthorchis viverrini]|uniref:Uncharacterized protein n=1 Tax=Opisthorchis viverrini TaxID=6198 RepID=A0A074Z9Z4_OPIVI|nr:hypothetical protein T265_09511 [Opisthorchis viverrini]KER22397.1 hypothetical protein T265_09511 [Opisthorchis viverrini]
MNAPEVHEHDKLFVFSDSRTCEYTVSSRKASVHKAVSVEDAHPLHSFLTSSPKPRCPNSLVDLVYADNIVLISEGEEKAQVFLDELTKSFGMQFSPTKCKIILVEVQSLNTLLTIEVEVLEVLGSFTYVGSRVSSDCSVTDEVNARICKARAAFANLRHLWRQNGLSLNLKGCVYQAIVRAVLLHGCETWPIRAADLRRLQVFDTRCLRSMARVGWCRRTREKAVRKHVFGCVTGTSIEKCVQHQKLRWLGHVLRMPNHRFPKRVLFSMPKSEWRKQRGGGGGGDRVILTVPGWRHYKIWLPTDVSGVLVISFYPDCLTQTHVPLGMSYRIQLAEVDLGNLLFEDKAPLEFDSSGSVSDQHLRDIAKECTRHFFKLFWALPTEVVDNVTISKLPKPTFRLPREKRIPAVRDLTRWERFAKLKGIKNKKKSRKVWDPTTQSWRPRWGKDHPYEDQFAKLTKEKNERRAKNELQRLRNIARVVKPGQAPPVGVLSESQGSRNELSRALSIAKVSDASMGRFNAPLDERKISKKTEKKMKPRLKLSQVVGSKSTKKSAKTRKPPAKKKPMKKKGSRTDLSLTGSTVIKISGWRQPNSENSIFRHENFFIPPSKYQWNLVKHRLNFIV